MPQKWMYVILDMTLRHSRHFFEAVQPKRGRPEEIPTTANVVGENETVGTSNAINQEAGLTPRNDVGQRPSIISSVPRPYHYHGPRHGTTLLCGWQQHRTDLPVSSPCAESPELRKSPLAWLAQHCAFDYSLLGPVLRGLQSW